jgi:hypothetical protein
MPLVPMFFLGARIDEPNLLTSILAGQMSLDMSADQRTSDLPFPGMHDTASRKWCVVVEMG